MARDITLTEIICVKQLSGLMTNLVDGREAELPNYEFEVDLLIETARPEMLKAWQSQQEPALFSESPPAPLSPGASAGGAASPIPTGGATPIWAGPIVTVVDGQSDRTFIESEAIHDALAAWDRDCAEGHIQPDFSTPWPTKLFNYIIRHAERADQRGEAA